MTTIRRFTLRLPEDLLARIKTAAEGDRRSIHSQILWLIERGLDRERPDSRA
jgi:hypothetical protein